MTRAFTEWLHTMGYPMALALLAAFLPPAWAASDRPSPRLPQEGHVLMIRHAYAPGIGDPSGFRLDDCATQRNLDKAGRGQAAAIGAWLRARGVDKARVYSSQWCRCIETARLLNLGPVTPLPALNSFFERPAEGEATTRALRAFLAGQANSRPLLVLVTHQVNISAVAGTGLGSGEGVLLELQPEGGTRVLDRLDFR